jgi:hypothetical protein
MIYKTSEESEQPFLHLVKSWGWFAELMVEPAIIDLFGERGMRLTGSASRFKTYRNGEAMEVDMVGTNGTPRSQLKRVADWNCPTLKIS